MFESTWRSAAIAATVAFAITAAASDISKPAERADGLWVVHEWGTYLTVQGSNGVTVGGMVDSEERLPRFVNERSQENYERAMMRCKMETPVTYFYTDRPRRASVRVEMKNGLLTHWYPRVKMFAPRPDRTAEHSMIDWGDFTVVPSNAAEPKRAPPKVEADDAWRFARQTDAGDVYFKVLDKDDTWTHECERFLFYRGLGKFDVPLKVTSKESGSGDVLELTNGSKQRLTGIFLVRVEGKTVAYRKLADMAGDETTSVSAREGLVAPKGGVMEIKNAIAADLTKTGLYPKEAAAMVNTWERSYFGTPGLRVLYVLPREVVDATIPIRIKPAPQELVRTMVARVEVMTPGLERRLADSVRASDSADVAVRAAAKAEIDALGRLREPMLRRIATLDVEPAIKARAVALLAGAK